MPNYKFKIVLQNEQFKIVDMFNDWVTAESAYEAKDIITKAYPPREGYSYILET